MTGNFRNGDAAFADYLINFGVSYRIPGKSNKEVETASDLKMD